jgi:hypothetical protein
VPYAVLAEAAASVEARDVAQAALAELTQDFPNSQN